MKALRKLILALSAASASFCFGEIPARFCEYIESVTSGSTATYVETDLELHYVSGKVYVDTQLMCEEFPQKVTCLFGASNENTLKVLSQAHRNGRNWTQNRDYEASVAAGQINTTLGGKIIWPIGFSVNIR